MTRTKVARVRVYFDADVLGLAHLLCRERPDFTYPGDPGLTHHKRQRPPCPITPDTKDPDWIPIVAKKGWLIVGRDRRIQQRVAELNAVRESGARMVNFAADDAGSTWAQLEVFMLRWRQIEELLDKPGPFIYQISRTGGIRSIPLTISTSRRPEPAPTDPAPTDPAPRRRSRPQLEQDRLPLDGEGPGGAFTGGKPQR